MVAGSNPAVPTMFFSYIHQPFIDHQTTALLVLSADNGKKPANDQGPAAVLIKVVPGSFNMFLLEK